MTTMNRLIEILTETAERLRDGAPYKWTHQGSCNCGHIAQTITGLNSDEIHRIALTGEGEWRDHAATHCASSGLAVDNLIASLLSVGLTIEALGHLEWLSDPAVTKWLPASRRALSHKQRDDVVLYLETWVQVLKADKLLRQDPNADILVNGFHYTRDFASEAALDVNPAAGRAA